MDRLLDAPALADPEACAVLEKRGIERGEGVLLRVHEPERIGELGLLADRRRQALHTEISGADPRGESRLEAAVHEDEEAASEDREGDTFDLVPADRGMIRRRRLEEASGDGLHVRVAPLLAPTSGQTRCRKVIERLAAKRRDPRRLACRPRCREALRVAEPALPGCVELAHAGVPAPGGSFSSQP
jgi:hypothetical protein